MLNSSAFFYLSTLEDGKSIKRRNWSNCRVAQHSGFLHFLISVFLDFVQFSLFNQLFFVSPEYPYLKLFFKLTVTLWLNRSIVVWDPSMCARHCVNSDEEGDGEGYSWSESISEPFLRRQSTFGGSPRCPASVRQEWTLFITAGWAAVLMLWHNLGKSNPKKRGCSPSGGAVMAAGAGSRVVHIRGQAAVSDNLLFIPSEPSHGIMPLRFRAGVFSTSLTDMPRGACSFSDARSRCVEDQY